MKLPELELDITITTTSAISTSISERIQSPTSSSDTSNSSNSQITLPLLHKEAASTSSSNNDDNNNDDNNINNDKKFMFLKKLRPWMPFIIWAILSIITLCIFLIYHKEIILILDKFAHSIKSMGIVGGIIFYLMIFLTTFPLMIGYSTLITLSGFTFGFSVGFFISYLAALTGAITVFYLSRKWFRKSVERLLHKNKSMGAIVKAVEKKGFKLLFLIRLAPYPYNVLNALLSAIHLPLKTFIKATALSLFKLMIHVWIGSKLSSFSAHHTFKGTTNVLKMGIMIVGISFAIGIIIYVWISARKAIKEIEQDENINDNEKIIIKYQVDEEMHMLNNITTNNNIRFRRGSGFCQDFIIDNLIITSNNENDKKNVIIEENSNDGISDTL